MCLGEDIVSQCLSLDFDIGSFHELEAILKLISGLGPVSVACLGRMYGRLTVTLLIPG